MKHILTNISCVYDITYKPAEQHVQVVLIRRTDCVSRILFCSTAKGKSMSQVQAFKTVTVLLTSLQCCRLKFTWTLH